MNPPLQEDIFARLPEEDQVGRQTPVLDYRHEPPSGLVGLIQCQVCGEDTQFNDIVHMRCKHSHCVSCVWRNAHAAYQSKPFAPAKCCIVMGIDAFTSHAIFSKKEMKTYISRLEEYTTPGRKLYCHDKDCGSFIPVESYSQRVGVCEKCGKNTCKACAQKSHFGACDPEHLAALGPDDHVLRFANSQGWKQCPNCRMLIERSEGCTHMTCKCGQHFCYLCGLGLGADAFDHDRYECSRKSGRPVID